VGEQYIAQKLTYNYEKDIKSINIFSAEPKIKLKFNLFIFKINLVELNIFINKKTPYSRGLTYLNINKVMLPNTTSLKEFNLKDLALLYKLFSTCYILDLEYYNLIYNDVVKNTPEIFIKPNPTEIPNFTHTAINAYWYNIIYISLRDEMH
jgi:hypothetical protein